MRIYCGLGKFSGGDKIIRDKIYDIRGQKVMLDFDLAALYGVETKVFNQAVKRNINRFPIDFMFQLTTEDWRRSQIVTGLGGEMKSGKAGPEKHRSKQYLPYAFTEHGVSCNSTAFMRLLRIYWMKRLGKGIGRIGSG